MWSITYFLMELSLSTTLVAPYNNHCESFLHKAYFIGTDLK